MRTIAQALTVALFFPITTQAAPWTPGGKIRNEMTEVISTLEDWTFENPFHSIELKDPGYVVKTEKCEFTVEFKYQQADPERGIKRTLSKKLQKGKKVDCEGVFRN